MAALVIFSHFLVSPKLNFVPMDRLSGEDGAPDL